MNSTVRNLLLSPRNPKVLGAFWDKNASPTLLRTDSSAGLIANVGVDSGFARNDFDSAPIYSEIKEATDTYGNMFMRIPKCYIRKTDGTGVKTWQVSKKQYPGFYLPWCFWDFTNNCELPYIDIGKYKATKDGSGKLESKPNLYPLINDNIVNFRTYAQNNNTGGLNGYQQLDIHVVDVLQTLFIIEYATLNYQSIMQGFTTGQYTATHLATVAESNTNQIIVANAHANLYQVGQAISIGTTQGGNQIFYGRTITGINVYDANNKAIIFNGAPVNIAVGNMMYNTGWRNGFSTGITASSGSLVSNSDGKYPCVYRGIESPFGDIWQFVDGVNINNNQAWVCKNANQYVSNAFASPYEQLGYVNGSTSAYVTTMGFDANLPFAAFATAAGGSSTTYYSDYYYQTTGQRIALFGGAWYSGASAGLSCWSLDASSSGAYLAVAGRLLKKPL